MKASTSQFINKPKYPNIFQTTVIKSFKTVIRESHKLLGSATELADELKHLSSQTVLNVL